MGFPAHGSGIIFEPSSPQQSHHGPKKPRHFNPMIEPQVKRQVVGLAQQRKRTDLEQRRFAEPNPD